MIAECSHHDVSGCIPKVIILVYGFIYRQPVYRIPHIGIGFVFHVLGLDAVDAEVLHVGYTDGYTILEFLGLD